MKTKIIIPAVFCALTFFTQAQTKQKREIGPFNKMEISGAASVDFTNSDSTSLAVEANANELDLIETKVSDGTLFIKGKGNLRHQFKVKVSGHNIESITLSGASSLTTINELKTDSLNIEVSGASRADVLLLAKSVKSTIAGASDVKLAGNTENLTANISGSSVFKGYYLNAANTSVTASGASNVKVFASNKIYANATGASSIKFKGDPKEVSVEGSSSSQITKVGSEENGKKGDGKDSTSTSFSFGDKKVIILDHEDKIDSIQRSHTVNRRFRHWAGFAMGVSGYFSPQGSFTIDKPYNYMELDYAKCFNFQVNLFQYNVHLVKNYMNLVTGFGFDFSQYQFANKVKLNPDSNFTWGDVDSTNAFSYKKNRLKTHYITVPLLLDFNTSADPRKAFHLSVGVVGKYFLGGRAKQVLEQGGNKYKYIRNDSYNINPFALDAYASIGYSFVTLYAQYTTNGMFQKNKGPELYPFSIGIRLVGF